MSQVEVDVHVRRLPFTVFDLKAALSAKHGLSNVGIVAETPETRKKPLANSERLEYSALGVTATPCHTPGFARFWTPNPSVSSA